MSQRRGEEKYIREGSSQGVPDPMCKSRYPEDSQKIQRNLYKGAVFVEVWSVAIVMLNSIPDGLGLRMTSQVYKLLLCKAYFLV